MKVYEVELTEDVLKKLILFSVDWEEEKSCFGYRANEKSDIEGNRIFFAEKDGKVCGYLFGNIHQSKDMEAIMPNGTAYFEVEELYVVPDVRSKGVGSALFQYVENLVKPEASYMMVGTATKNWKAILHFYLEELGMEFWSARLFKKI